METFFYRYRVRRKSSHSKYFVVVKCLVRPSRFEPDGHYSEIEIVSRPPDHGEAYALCERLNEEEKKKEKAGAE